MSILRRRGFFFSRLIHRNTISRHHCNGDIVNHARCQRFSLVHRVSSTLVYVRPPHSGSNYTLFRHRFLSVVPIASSRGQS